MKVGVDDVGQTLLRKASDRISATLLSHIVVAIVHVDPRREIVDALLVRVMMDPTIAIKFDCRTPKADRSIAQSVRIMLPRFDVTNIRRFSGDFGRFLTDFAGFEASGTPRAVLRR